MPLGEPREGSEHPQVNLRDVSTEEIFGEIRRRRLPAHEIAGALDMEGPQRIDLRRYALRLLGVLTLVLITFIGILSFQGKEIPDLLSGLAGSGLGGIAGILSGGGDGGD